MTYIIGIRCDICGTFVTEDYDGQQHTVPEGWGHATVRLPMPGPNSAHIDICPECCERIASRDPTHRPKVDSKTTPMHRPGVDDKTVMSPDWTHHDSVTRCAR